MAPPPPSPLLTHLLDELVGEILVRLPPDEPADILRASLVCKRWSRLLSDPAFGRRYRELHRAPPLLGFFHNTYESGPVPRFVSTVASPCSPPALHCSNWWTLDCRHDRVLIHRFGRPDLVVFDPLTGEQPHLPLPPYSHFFCAGAVLCSVAGCDHLDCHGGPFLVVFVGTNCDRATWASVYSSETGAWSASSSVELGGRYIQAWPSLCIGDSLYFMVYRGRSILRYDLAVRGFSLIDVPAEYDDISTVVMVDDGRLGFMGVEDRNLHLWAWQEAGADGSAGWRRCRVIELATLLPGPDKTFSPRVVGFVEGTDIVFLSTDVGIFTLKIKSGRVAKVGEKRARIAIVPYSSFCLPGV
ncbi:hypothetical protein EJB05_15375, partial [Eragrostis curvula]